MLSEKEVYRRQFNHEADAVRAARAERRRNLDPLAKRERSAAFWRRMNETNKNFGLVHTSAFYRHPGFRPYVLPKLQAWLNDRARKAEDAWRTEVRRSSEAAAYRKALAKAAPLPLFESSAQA